MTMNVIKTSLITSLLVLFIACGSDTSDARVGRPATFVEPILLVKTTGYYPKVKLPLLIWDSYEYIDIIVHPYLGGKEKGCVVVQANGRPIKMNTEIKFLEDAPCLYSRLTTEDGVPHIYNAGLMKILIVSTGEEVYTWSLAVEFIK